MKSQPFEIVIDELTERFREIPSCILTPAYEIVVDERMEVFNDS